MKVDYHPLFQSDFDHAARYYLKHGGRDLAGQFIDEVEKALFRITANPLAHSTVFNNVRRLRLKRFNAYAIRYSFDDATNTIFIGSIVHGARDPAVARERFD